MKLTKFIAIGCAIATVQACGVAGLYNESTSNSESVRLAVSNNNIHGAAESAIYIDAPTNEVIAYDIVHRPDWYKSPHKIISSGLPFYFVAEELGNKHGLFVKYGPDVNPNIPVNLIYENGTAFGALETLSSTTGLSYHVEDDSITWSMFQVERFDMSYVGVEDNYMIGEEGGEDDEGNEATVSVGSNKDQFSNVRGKEINIYEEVEAALTSIVGGYGEVIASPASSSVVVRTTGARMKRVNAYMDSINAALSKQVALEVKVLKFWTANSAAGGIDWRVVRESLNSSVSFGGSFASNGLASSNIPPSTIEMTKQFGNWTTANLLIAALEEQGAVTVVTEPRVVTQVNRVAELAVSELQGYIKRTEVTNTGDQSSTSIDPGTVKDGYSIYMMANVDRKNRVFLHISSLLSDLLKIDRKEVGESAIESPNFIENKFTQSLALKSGQTMVANGLKQVVNRSEVVSPFDTGDLPAFKSADTLIEETLVLITPTVIEMDN